MNKPAIIKALGQFGSVRAGLLVNQLAQLAAPEERTAYAQVRPVTNNLGFRISINGKPLPEGSEVQWGVYSNTYGVSSSVEAKSDGVIELEHTHFNDPNKPATLVRLSTTAKSVDETQFRVDLPPANLDQLTLVNVQTGRLRLDLRNLEHLNAPATKVNLIVALHEPEEQRRIFPSYNKGFEMPVGSSIILPNIQHGTYDISITLPGAERWLGSAAVGPGAPPAEVELKPGSDLHYEIVMPDGTHQFGAPLLKDGEEVNGDPDFKTHTYRGLPCGNYVLRILGSQPMEKDSAGRDIQRGPDEVSFAGREVTFTIKPGSPALIELGEIQLKALPEKPKAAERK